MSLIEMIKTTKNNSTKKLIGVEWMMWINSNKQMMNTISIEILLKKNHWQEIKEL
jgi:hypothetical protein